RRGRHERPAHRSPSHHGCCWKQCTLRQGRVQRWESHSAVGWRKCQALGETEQNGHGRWRCGAAAANLCLETTRRCPPCNAELARHRQVRVCQGWWLTADVGQGVHKQTKGC